MSGRERIKKPSFEAALDEAKRSWAYMAGLINDGGSPERRHLEAALRAGAGRDEMVTVPAVVLNHLADLLYGGKSGRPTKSNIEKEFDAWRRAEKMVAEIKALQRAGCSMTKAYEAYAKARGGKAKSIERQYRQALGIVRERRAEVAAMMQRAAQLTGISVQDQIAMLDDGEPK
jgi:hypothetical protein